VANTVQTLSIPEAPPRPWSLPRSLALTLRFCRQKPLGAIGAVIVLALIVMAVFADRIAPYAYDESVARMKPPSVKYWMGTDNLGRDIWSRVVFGARISVTVGFSTVLVATVLATLIGVSSAYLGGSYDILVQRVVDAWMSFPALVIVLSMLAALGPGLLNLILALSILGAAGTSRIIRGATLSVMQHPYIEATRALGFVHPDLCPKEAFEPYFEHLAELDLRGYFALARDLLSHDASDLLPQIRVPTLVVAGERDLFTPVQRSREMAAQIPGAELLLLRQGSHAALVEQPELVALSVEKFLKLHGLAPGDAQQAAKKN